MNTSQWSNATTFGPIICYSAVGKPLPIRTQNESQKPGHAIPTEYKTLSTEFVTTLTTSVERPVITITKTRPTETHGTITHVNTTGTTITDRTSTMYTTTITIMIGVGVTTSLVTRLGTKTPDV